MSLVDVAKASKRAVEDIKDGNGPIFLECLTYRFRAHSMFDAELYREKDEVLEWKKKDPLVLFEKRLTEMGLWSDINVQELEDEIQTSIDEAVEFAQIGTLEPLNELEKFVYWEADNG